MIFKNWRGTRAWNYIKSRKFSVNTGVYESKFDPDPLLYPLLGWDV